MTNALNSNYSQESREMMPVCQGRVRSNWIGLVQLVRREIYPGRLRLQIANSPASKVVRG